MQKMLIFFEKTFLTEVKLLDEFNVNLILAISKYELNEIGKLQVPPNDIFPNLRYFQNSYFIL